LTIFIKVLELTVSNDNTRTYEAKTKCLSGDIRERPILFSAPMVRALLDGSKTQTRRVIKMPPSWDCIVYADWGNGFWPYRSDDGESPNYDNNEIPLNCPHGQPGDRLWVRETWAPHPDFPRSVGRTVYRADPECEHDVARWYPSIHMRREYSRILLEIVSVRVERLIAITYEDARAEGVDLTIWSGIAINGYKALWESINGSGSWSANPWVWVIEFKRVAT
jgi:hypothetical protein